MTDKQVIQNTLRFCNKLRRMRNYPPVDKLECGMRRNGFNCPIKRTVGALVVTRTKAEIDVLDSAGKLRRVWVPLSRSAQMFVDLFDDGVFPNLEA